MPPKINLFQTNIKSIEITFELIFELSSLVRVTHKVHTFIFAHKLLAYTPTTHPPSPSTSVQILFSKVDMTKIYFANYNQSKDHKQRHKSYLNGSLFYFFFVRIL